MVSIYLFIFDTTRQKWMRFKEFMIFFIICHLHLVTTYEFKSINYHMKLCKILSSTLIDSENDEQIKYDI